MQKVKIHIGIIGYLPFEFNRKRLENWKSDIFEVIGISDYVINTSRSDTTDWGYSDATLNNELPQRNLEDIFIGITYVPIENNYYARRLDDNRVIISYCDIHRDIVANNIPIENLVLRVIYASSLIFFIEKNIPSAQMKRHELLHDDTRRCIYDMNGNDKADVIYSLNKPQLCNGCVAILRARKLSNNIIDRVNHELRGIRKDRFSEIVCFVKRKPIISMLITLLVGIAISLAANFIYDWIKTSVISGHTTEIIDVL